MSADDFVDAAAKDNISKLILLYEEDNFLIDRQDRDGYTALMLATDSNSRNVIRFLLNKGSDVGAKNRSDWTALHLACRNNHLLVAKWLIWAGSDANLKNSRGKNAFWYIDDPEKRQQLEDEAAAITADLNADVVFRACVEKGTLEKLPESGKYNKKIISRVFPNTQNTLLHAACWGQRLDVVTQLLENGADYNCTNMDGLDPVSIALLSGNLDIARLFVLKHILDKGQYSFDPFDIESSHPYEDGKTIYKPVEVAGASAYIITFDKRSSTAENDFIRFFKNTEYSEFWGLPKYYGGDASSEKIFPGVHGIPPLVIPSSHFIVYFSSAILLRSNCGWGYRMTIAPSAGLRDVNRTLEVAVQEGHIDIIRDLIDAGADLFHRNSSGKSMLELALERSHEDIVYMITEFDMPYDIQTGAYNVAHHGSWFQLLDAHSGLHTEARAEIVRDLLSSISAECKDTDGVIKQLARLKDEHDREAISITDKHTRAIITEYLLFCGRYELFTSESPLHATDTSIVIRAVDYKAAEDYGAVFDSLLPDHFIAREVNFETFCQAILDMGLHKQIQDVKKRMKIIQRDIEKIHTDAETENVYLREDFIDFCKRNFGATRPVVIKFMLNKNQYLKEQKLRAARKLLPLYIMELLRGPTEEEFFEASAKLGVVQGKYLSDYSYGLVMPEGDRSLKVIHECERPDHRQLRSYALQIALAIQHLHKHGIVHGDIKLSNIIRIDDRLCLIDMDAAVNVDKGEYLGAKFSSSVLPPEMFYKLASTEEEEQFKQYFSEEAAHELPLWMKVKPTPTGDTTGTFVVRTFKEVISHGAGDRDSFANPSSETDSFSSSFGKSSMNLSVKSSAKSSSRSGLKTSSLKATRSTFSASVSSPAVKFLATSKAMSMKFTPASWKDDISSLHSGSSFCSNGDKIFSELMETLLPYPLVKANFHHDIWAFGVLLFQLFCGEPLLPVDRDDDLAGSYAVIQAATWTDEAVRARIFEFRGKVKDESVLHFIHSLLRARPEDRFQSMEDVLFHPFFKQSHIHQITPDTPFIKLAKSKGLVRLNDMPEIASQIWKFGKVDFQLTSMEEQKKEEVRAALPKETMELLELTRRVLLECLAVTDSLSLHDKITLESEVTKEQKRYDEVQASILKNLVIDQEEMQAKVFDALFLKISNGVNIAFKSKPQQRAESSIDLYRDATRIFPDFSKVLNHVASEVGATAELPPIKAYIRVCEKLVLEYEDNVGKVTDLVRGKILCASVEEMSQIIACLAGLDTGLVARLRNPLFALAVQTGGSRDSIADALRKRNNHSSFVRSKIKKGTEVLGKRRSSLTKPTVVAVRTSVVGGTAQDGTEGGGGGEGVGGIAADDPESIEAAVEKLLHFPSRESEKMKVKIQIVVAKNRLARLGDCLLNFTMSTDTAEHVCEVQVALEKVEVARGDALGGHDSYNWVRSVRSLLAKVSGQGSKIIVNDATAISPSAAAGVAVTAVTAAVGESSGASLASLMPAYAAAHWHQKAKRNKPNMGKKTKEPMAMDTGTSSSNNDVVDSDAQSKDSPTETPAVNVGEAQPADIIKPPPSFKERLAARALHKQMAAMMLPSSFQSTEAGGTQGNESSTVSASPESTQQVPSSSGINRKDRESQAHHSPSDSQGDDTSSDSDSDSNKSVKSTASTGANVAYFASMSDSVQQTEGIKSSAASPMAIDTFTTISGTEIAEVMADTTARADELMIAVSSCVPASASPLIAGIQKSLNNGASLTAEALTMLQPQPHPGTGGPTATSAPAAQRQGLAGLVSRMKPLSFADWNIFDRDRSGGVAAETLSASDINITNIVDLNEERKEVQNKSKHFQLSGWSGQGRERTLGHGLFNGALVTEGSEDDADDEPCSWPWTLSPIRGTSLSMGAGMKYRSSTPWGVEAVTPTSPRSPRHYKSMLSAKDDEVRVHLQTIAQLREQVVRKDAALRECAEREAGLSQQLAEREDFYRQQLAVREDEVVVLKQYKEQLRKREAELRVQQITNLQLRKQVASIKCSSCSEGLS